MKLRLLIIGAIIFIFFISSYYIWFIDVIFAPVNILSVANNTEGDTFTVTQFWNRGDFYTVELIHRDPDGRRASVIIDPDMIKIWRCRTIIFEETKEYHIFVKGRLLCRYNWDEKRLIRSNGVSITAGR